MNPIRKQARKAGLLYFLMGVTAPIGLLIVPSRVIVKGDAAATADNLRASEWLFRIGIGSELVHQTIAIFLVLSLYRLFKPVSETLARQLVVLGALVSVPIVFFNVVNELAALILVRGPDYLRAFDSGQRDGLAYMFLRLHGMGLEVAAIFWGLWLFPFGLLVIRSGFIPRILGVLMMIAGVGYLVSSFTTVLAPQYDSVVGTFTMILETGELPIIFWLLIWGATEPRSPAGPPAVSPGPAPHGAAA